MSPLKLDLYSRALQQRSQVPATQFWAMLRSQLYLAAGFVGASIAVVGLRLLLTSEASRFTVYEMAFAAIAGAAITVFAWYRAGRALDPVASDTVDATLPGGDHAARTFGTLSGG